MTAHELIDSIFSKPQGGPGHLRRITRRQLDYLRSLIEADEEGGAVREGAPGSLIWMPMGRWKYVLTEDRLGDKHMLTRLGNIVPSGTGKLF
jgi:hypothetical protein